MAAKKYEVIVNKNRRHNSFSEANALKTYNWWLNFYRNNPSAKVELLVDGVVKNPK